MIYSSVFRFRPPAAPENSEPLALTHVVDKRPQVLIELCRAYNHKESATPAGTVLREILKSEAATAIVLYDDGDQPGSSGRGVNGIDRDRPQSGKGVFWQFFDWIDKSSFEVSADAFTTFRVSMSTLQRARVLLSLFLFLFLLPFPPSFVFISYRSLTTSRLVLGTSHETQKPDTWISFHEFRGFLRPLQQNLSSIEQLCD
jgi:hypothetical protein